MPTLGEACQRLHVSRRTLDKWLARLGIEPTRHAWDYRFYEITADELEQIADARRKLPGHLTGAFIPTSSPLAFDRRPARETTVSDASPTVTHTPRQRPLRAEASTPLPDGWMSRTDCADLHGFPRTTLRRWCDDGRIETSSATFGGEHGTFAIAQPVTARGMRQFYALASGRADFQRCDTCPHEDSGEDADAPPA